MKKVILLIALVAAPLFSSGQSIFDELEEMDGVSSVVLSKDAFLILKKFKAESLKDNDMMEAFQMIQDLEELKMFSADKASIATKMQTMVKSAVKTNGLVELMRVKDKETKVWIYVKATQNSDFVKEVLMFSNVIGKRSDGMSEAIVISLTGSIDINKISELADKFIKESDTKVSVKKD